MDVARKQLDHFIAVSIETHVSLKDCITKGLSGEKKKKKTTMIIDVAISL